ncbi:4-(cytidine 5'-diphospho)-2-C-methyl-D-erythritol kinase [Micromonospora peucetia]|uniref:4-diphosphocytidyl-2-C-methyl-D-erythritol kinase n=1 Tax=Micromonospora peucetia TaxID=47871 RepID=A0A1C6UIJ4_9ACTN|nr:4-(cytidine 5'-diphospho)-2-C-methyl-D-erythritol kinase [Micromonospora peucetia]MCX4386805.1 4-(cytidine 5'-diphospho)-2-C-methyl-D-erythritol kinase [Micromonospora peucetia]WSA34124.1 4-(cytidine 5'-diphospho)-2-C-methyl-D-erythritol kinase [Micromonospora peucetia]SCL53791.1 4-diphosphocytidyl-2-C-methyl-D-erythritol kinase [Micromonospora peucetia]
MTEAWGPDDEGEQRRRGASGPVRVRVPAKVNLHLGVGPLRGDGYHELNTVYHAISIHDELTARRGDTLTLTMEGEGTGELALDDTNLVIRAAHALAAHAGVPAHARLHLRKQIPLAGGLAGGSADAAAALVACDALWGTGLSRDELARIAADLGSDVPFLIHGGTALGTGRGETVSPVLARPTTWHWVVAIADGGLSTPAAYRELDRLREAGVAGEPLGSTDALFAALRQRDPRVLAETLGNDLQDAALAMRPSLAETLKAGEAAGALAGIVSGSGPTCVFLATDAADAERIATELASADVCRTARTAHGPVPGARIA